MALLYAAYRHLSVSQKCLYPIVFYNDLYMQLNKNVPKINKCCKSSKSLSKESLDQDEHFF